MMSEIINKEYKNLFNEENEFIYENKNKVYDGFIVPVYKDYKNLIKIKLYL